MKSAKIFLVGENESQITEMVETSFEKEDILQVLLESHPDLLAGDQIDPDNPRRWLLVSREMGIPGQEKGSNVWSLDHLFLDQVGIPTFVECKRSSDTRARREVVAQMLDYAANGISYWSIDALRQAAQLTAAKKERELDEEIQKLVAADSPIDIEEFWQTVEKNLRDGRIRLLFVTDSLPRELRRLVEFLNEKMKDVEVLAVEVKQFIGQGKHKVIVPRVIGATETARDAKTGTKPKQPQVTRDSYLERCEEEDIRDFYSYVMDRGEEQGFSISWGSAGFSVGYVIREPKTRIPLLLCYPPDRFEFTLEYLRRNNADEKTIRQETLALKTLVPSGKMTLRTSITPGNAEKMKDTVDFILSKASEWLGINQQHS